MTTFDDIQGLWDQQGGPSLPPPGAGALIALAEKNTREVKMKHLWTIGILSVTILLFSGYVTLYTGFRFSLFHLGLSLMFFSLLLRLAAEAVSYGQFRRIDIRSDLTTYTRDITTFYGKRRKIHFWLTPVMLGAYVVGFVLLLPVFKSSLSGGFYLYILISGFGYFLAMVWMVARQIKKEMALLAFLKGVRVGDFF